MLNGKKFEKFYFIDFAALRLCERIFLAKAQSRKTKPSNPKKKSAFIQSRSVKLPVDF